MNFEWDETKNAGNLSKHGIDFSFSQHVFLDPDGVEIFDRAVDDENRYHFLGAIQANIFLVVFAEIKENTIRIISARKATRREREFYYERKKIY